MPMVDTLVEKPVSLACYFSTLVFTCEDTVSVLSRKGDLGSHHASVHWIIFTEIVQ